MGSMPPARQRARKSPAPSAGSTPRPRNPPVPFIGAAALPPIPAGYIFLLVTMLLGVLTLHLAGATLIEAVVTVEMLLGAITVLVWRLRK